MHSAQPVLFQVGAWGSVTAAGRPGTPSESDGGRVCRGRRCFDVITAEEGVWLPHLGLPFCRPLGLAPRAHAHMESA